MENKFRFIISLLILSFALAVPAMAQTGGAGDETIHQDKKASYDYETHIGEITLTSFVPGEMKVVSEAKAIDAILVLDFSSSMNDGYTSSDTYSELTVDKIFTTTNLYYSDGTVASVSLSASQNKDDVVYQSSGAKNQLFWNYGGTDYPVRVATYGDTNSGSTHRYWVYIVVDGKKVFIRADGSTIMEKDPAVNIGYFRPMPIGVDDFYITPVQGAANGEKTLFVTMKKTTGTPVQKRIDALRMAAGNFIDQIAAHASKTGKKDRVAVVMFGTSGSYDYPTVLNENNNSNEDYLNSTNYLQNNTSSSKSDKKTYLMEFPTDRKPGTKSDGKTPNTDSDIEGRVRIGKRFVDLSSDNAADFLKFAISNNNPAGNTPVYLGVKVAKELMNRTGRTGNDVARYVIVFTDGDPTQTSGSVWNSGQGADQAVSLAYDMKNSSTLKSDVYTIYCNSSSPSDKTKQFMDHLSSNYPVAKKYNDSTTKLPDADAKYFKTATDNLKEVFDAIAGEIIVEANSKYDVNTTMKDFVNNNYFQYPDNADEGDIKVYTQNCTSYSKGTGGAPDLYEFNSELVDITSGVNVVLTRANPAVEGSKDLVEVYGFNYSENWCGMDITSGSPGVIHGKQLVIKFPFIFKGGNEVSGALKTNTEESGIYPAQKNDDGTPKVDEDGKPIPEEETDSKFTPPVIYFNTLTITRKNLEPGETAIYEVTRDGSFICRIALGGEDGKETSGVSKTIYGLPGDEGVKFKVSETNWNWAYHEAGSPLPSDEKTVTISSGQPIPLTYEFSGAHLDKTGDHPAERHNHGESFIVNKMKVSTSTSTE